MRFDCGSDLRYTDRQAYVISKRHRQQIGLRVAGWKKRCIARQREVRNNATEGTGEKLLEKVFSAAHVEPSAEAPKIAAASKEFVVNVAHSIDEVNSEQWNAAATASGNLNPFVLHGFLKALEDSYSAVKQTGWMPHHLIVREKDKADEIAGCCPVYLKVGGPRLLVKSINDKAAVVTALGKAITKLTDDYGISSSHVTFNEEEEWDSLGKMGFLQRTGIQYHWENPGYANFEDFLGNLKQAKRKNIRQERKAIMQSGLKIRRLSGDDLKPSHWDQFYEFYRNTTDMKWGSAYLTQEFFQELGTTLAEHVLLVVAQEGDANSPLVAGALNLIGSDAIYGRNWGCSWGCRVKHLHFEMCYYQAQEEAIERGLPRVEAGAQGEHKIQRGYLPSKTFSSHYIRDPVLRSIIDRHLENERQAIDHNLEVLGEIASPYKVA